MDELRQRLNRIIDEATREYRQRTVKPTMVRHIPAAVIAWPAILVRVDEQGIPSTLVAAGRLEMVNWIKGNLPGPAERIVVMRLDGSNYIPT